jgi:ribosome-associated protein
MSRKPTKGYYVKGHFVAEGSDLDLELKREQKGQDLSSKTDLKRESTELQKLGEDLLELRQDAMLQLVAQEHVPEALHEAIREAKKITNFEGKRRQMQFVGKLMRKLDDDQVQAIRAALDVQHNGSAEETLALHMAEHWRDRLLQDDARGWAESEWIGHFNGFSITFPGAARVGYDPEDLLRKLRRQVTEFGLPNLMIFGGGGGIENCSGVPATINEMLLQSHDGVLRLFPVWPRDRAAQFGNLRARGAFLVSSQFREGRV